MGSEGEKRGRLPKSGGAVTAFGLISSTETSVDSASMKSEFGRGKMKAELTESRDLESFEALTQGDVSAL